jgi:hypothetical protein
MKGEKQATSPWVYVAAGCGVMLVVGVVALVGLGYGAVRWGRQLKDDLKDPATRTAKAKAVLGADTLPDGYYPVMAMSIPLVMDVAVLSDREPDASGQVHGGGQRGFVYMQFLSTGGSEKDLRDYFEGRTNDSAILRRNKINLDVRDQEVIRRGVIRSQGYPVLFLAQRGDMKMNDTHSKGVHSLLLVDCPQDQRMRMGILFGPDPEPAAPVATANFAGTPADEATVTAFLGHFHLCR